MAAMVPRNVISSFESTAIFPYNRNRFTDADYAPFDLTDRFDPVQDLSNQNQSGQQEQLEEPQSQDDEDTSQLVSVASDHTACTDPCTSTKSTAYVSPRSDRRPTACTDPCTSTKSTSYVSPREIHPLPKAGPRKTQNRRKRGSTTILTDAPVRYQLAGERKKSKPVPKAKKAVKKSLFTAPSCQSSDSSDDDEWPCLICGEPYSSSKPGDDWIQCQMCLLWAHDACSPGLDKFICPNCDSESE